MLVIPRTFQRGFVLAIPKEVSRYAPAGEKTTTHPVLSLIVKQMNTKHLPNEYRHELTSVVITKIKLKKIKRCIRNIS